MKSLRGFVLITVLVVVFWFLWLLHQVAIRLHRGMQQRIQQRMKFVKNQILTASKALTLFWMDHLVLCHPNNCK